MAAGALMSQNGKMWRLVGVRFILQQVNSPSRTVSVTRNCLYCDVISSLRCLDQPAEIHVCK